MEIVAQDAESVTIKISRKEDASLSTILHAFSVELASEPSRIDTELLNISEESALALVNAYFEMPKPAVKD